jgi:hypothetical protein
LYGDDILKYLWIILACFLCNCISSSTAYGWEEPISTTREDIIRWFEEGVKQKATHLLVVCDQFSYEDFPDYIYWDQLPQERVTFWNNQEMFGVMEAYALHLDMNEQINEYRSWHLNIQLE